MSLWEKINQARQLTEIRTRAKRDVRPGSGCKHQTSPPGKARQGKFWWRTRADDRLGIFTALEHSMRIRIGARDKIGRILGYIHLPQSSPTGTKAAALSSLAWKGTYKISNQASRPLQYLPATQWAKLPASLSHKSFSTSTSKSLQHDGPREESAEREPNENGHKYSNSQSRPQPKRSPFFSAYPCSSMWQMLSIHHCIHREALNASQRNTYQLVSSAFRYRNHLPGWPQPLQVS